MAAMNPQVQSIRYSVNWPIKWSEFGKLFPSGHISKIFVTSFNNVPLHWKAELFIPSIDSPGIGFHLNYLTGPIEKIENTEYAFSIMKPDLSIAETDERGGYEARRGVGYGWDEFYFGKDPVAFRAKYGLQESRPFIIAITLKIPMSVFSFTPTATTPTVSQKWIDMFPNIQDQEKSIGWDVKLISFADAEFYCHKEIIAQSEPLRNKFRPRPAGQPDNEYEFRLNSTVLKNLIQFLYTGQADLGNVKTKNQIKLAEASDKYELKALKEACVVVLWNEVKNPKSWAKILHYSLVRDVFHSGDLRDLKFRALDVLAENYDALMPNDDDNEDEENEKLVNFYGGGSGNIKLKQCLLFLSRRVEPDLSG